MQEKTIREVRENAKQLEAEIRKLVDSFVKNNDNCRVVIDLSAAYKHNVDGSATYIGTQIDVNVTI